MTKKLPLKTAPQNYKKSLSRLMAVQLLYQSSFYENDVDFKQLKEELIENYLLDADNENTSSYRKKIDEKFLDNLTEGFALAAETIDAEISHFLKGDFSIDKLEGVSLQLLRCATFELKFMTDIPAKVVVGEYVDIAASFFSDKRLGFVNATLDALAKKLRPTEF